VINTGNGSFNSLDELLVLRSRGLAYAPDLAFVVVVGNDFTDRPPFVDQVDWLEREGFHDPSAREALRAGQAERPALTGPKTGPARALFLTVSQLVNRSFLAISGSKAITPLVSGSREPSDLGAATATPPASPPPTATPSSSATSPVATASLVESLPTDVASVPPRSETSEALERRYPFLHEHTAALREIVATCAA